MLRPGCARTRWLAAATGIAAFFWTLAAAGGDRATATVSVRLETRSGGSLEGLVVDHNDHGLVVVRENVPYVFAWCELTGDSAWGAKKALLELDKGGAASLTGLDHLTLGRFALSVERTDIAANEFRAALDRRPSLRHRVEKAWREFNALAGAERRGLPDEALKIDHPANLKAPAPHEGQGDRAVELAARPEPALRSRVYESYRTFGEKVRKTLGADIELVETDHFLIWTDWPKPDRPELTELCEAMYRAVCQQFGVDSSGSIFLSKCPVFCFQKPARFRRFAREFDGYGGRNSVGYTRSIEKNGHVHLALVSRGASRLDRDRFAGTLVHEGTHAVLHRLFSSRLIPHWVNEGYAELVTERVLGRRSVTGENAALLARQYVRYDWPLGDLLVSMSPIAVHQYPLAQSVITYLQETNADKFTEFIRRLKSGEDPASALAGSYDGLSVDRIERQWRMWIRTGDPALPALDADKSAPRSRSETADN